MENMSWIVDDTGTDDVIQQNNPQNTFSSSAVRSLKVLQEHCMLVEMSGSMNAQVPRAINARVQNIQG
jgi:hypothetical protein